MKNAILNTSLKVLLLLFVAFLLSACSSGGQATEDPTEDLPAQDFSPVISATGVVKPERWATLSFPSGGRIAEILVEPGELVEEGQALARLSGREQAQAALSATELELLNAQQALDDLYENADVQRAQAQLALANARDALKDAQYNWTVRQEGNRASSNTIDAAEANLVLANEEVDRAEQAYDHAKGEASRALALSNLAAAKQKRDSIQRNLNWYLGKPTEIEQALLDAELAEAEANLAAAERAYEKVKDGPDPEAVAMAETRLENAQASTAAAKNALADMELRAPFAGTISEIPNRANEFVAPGQPILLIADLTALIIETTDLNEIDVAQIDIGDPATITFDALPEVVLQGTLSYIAPKASEGTGVNYPVEVRLEEGFPESVRWGMTAFVDIELER